MEIKLGKKNICEWLKKIKNEKKYYLYTVKFEWVMDERVMPVDLKGMVKRRPRCKKKKKTR